MALQLMNSLYPTGENVLKTTLTQWTMGPIANVQGHGAVGDGSTDDHTAFSAAQTAAVTSGAGAVFVPPGNYALDSDLTLASGAAMQLSIGAQITLASGATFTVNGLLHAPRQELFPGRGRVTLANHITSPEWWGVTRAAPTEHTIAAGAITASADILSIDTESDAAADDLDTITAGSDGDVLLLRCQDAARVVTVKHGTGNIWLDSDTDADLDSLATWLALKYSSTYSAWIEVARLTACAMEGDQAAGLSLGGAAFYNVGTSGGQLVALQASNAKLPPGVLPDIAVGMSILDTHDYSLSAGSPPFIVMSGISSNAKIISIGYHGVSFTGTADFNCIFNGITTGYEGNSNNYCTGTKVALSSSFILSTDPVAAGSQDGLFVFKKSANGNVWNGLGSLSTAASNNQTILSGSIALDALLSSIKVGTVGYTDTGDAGQITITVEG